jgi:hypothetical protein
MHKINKKAVESVRVYRKSICHEYTVLEEEVKTSWFSKPKIYPKRVLNRFDFGFYGKFYEKYTPVEDINTKFYYVEDMYLYYQPYLEIKMVSGKIHEKYFNTRDELLTWFNNKLSGLDLIDLNT